MRILTFVLIFSQLLFYCLSASNPKKCREPGIFCETCSSLVACIEGGNATFTKEPVDTCTSPERCVGGSCVKNTTDPFCSGLADLKFVCRHVGIFPDPFYCNKFVMCVDTGSSLVAYLDECEQGFQYNIEDSLCNIKLKDGQCEDGIYPISPCQQPGQSEAVPEKPELYYVCERYSETDVLYPVLNVCPGGQVYGNYMCQDEYSLTTTASLSS